MVAVGRLFKAWGIRGELGAEIYSSHPGRAEKLKDVVLELADGKTRPSRVERVWWHDGRPVFKFEGIDSISDAERWAGADILVADSEREHARRRRLFACRSDRLRAVESRNESRRGSRG